MILPNFFIVGAAKCGTASLYYYLREHPEIYMSPIKEPHFFSDDIDIDKFSEDYKKSLLKDVGRYVNGPMDKIIHAAHIRNLEQYCKLFKNVKNEKAIGEISNSYLYSKTAARNIKKMIPNAKIIMVLRNPIERAFSHYLMDLHIGYSKEPTFMRAIKKAMQSEEKSWGAGRLYLELGLYYEQVKRYLEIFGSRTVKIILFERIKKDVSGVMREIFSFLDVYPFFEIVFHKRYNISLIPKYKLLNRLLWKIGAQNFFARINNELFNKKRNVSLSNKERDFLRLYYKKDIMKLSDLINRDLSEWLK